MAAYEIPVLLASWEAGANLSAKQFFAVKLSSDKAVLAGAGEAIVGILQNDPASGDTASVMMLGISKAELGTTVSAVLTQLTPDGNGNLVPATTGNRVVALALETGSDGDIIPVFVIPQGIY